MKIISFITAIESIQKIQKHFGLWNIKASRDPPDTFDVPVIYEPLYISID
ncbi:MAG: hypothetical protein ACMUIP_10300 [bacterium]